MKKPLALALGVTAAIALAAAILPVAPEASAFEYLAKVWSSNGDIYYLKNLHQPFTQDDLRWWKADGSTGVWKWSDVRWIEFPKNIGWWRGGPKEVERARMAEVMFWNGQQDKAYVEIASIEGDDPWGGRMVPGNMLTKIEFASRLAPPPVPPQVWNCPNGHLWENPGFRFCPYDGNKLVLGPKK